MSQASLCIAFIFPLWLCFLLPVVSYAFYTFVTSFREGVLSPFLIHLLGPPCSSTWATLLSHGGHIYHCEFVSRREGWTEIQQHSFSLGQLRPVRCYCLEINNRVDTPVLPGIERIHRGTQSGGAAGYHAANSNPGTGTQQVPHRCCMNKLMCLEVKIGMSRKRSLSNCHCC